MPQARKTWYTYQRKLSKVCRPHLKNVITFFLPRKLHNDNQKDIHTWTKGFGSQITQYSLQFALVLPLHEPKNPSEPHPLLSNQMLWMTVHSQQTFERISIYVYERKKADQVKEKAFFLRLDVTYCELVSTGQPELWFR